MRQAARLLFLAGAVAIGLFLFRAAPRDVTLVYAVEGGGAHQLEVDVEKAGEVVRHAELRLAPGETQASHHVRLTDGDYLLRLTVSGAGPARRIERSIQVTESATIVISLGD